MLRLSDLLGAGAGRHALTIIIHLPYPPAPLNPNRRVHWAVAAKHAKAYRLECFALTKAALGRRRIRGVTAINLTFHPPDKRKRDDDNIIRAFKSGRDGLADALGIDDNTLRPVYCVSMPLPGGAVVVSIDAV